MAQYKRKLSKGDYWYYKFDYQRKTYYSKAIYRSKAEAKKAEAEKYSEVQESYKYPSQPQEISLLQAINERLDTLKVKKSKKYYNESRYYLSILLNTIGDKPLREISKSDINNLLLQVANGLKSNGQDNYKVNALLRIIKACLNQCINDHDLNLKNPAVGIKQFPIKKQLKYIPSDEDIKQVKLLCNRRQNLLIDFIMDTGARINEALKVKGEDIKDGYVVLYTRKSYNSNLQPRKVSLSLKFPTLKPDELLFPDWTEQPKFLQRKVSFLNQKNWGFHNLRHRYASLLSKQGLPIYEIMSRLGNSNISTTQIYLQLL